MYPNRNHLPDWKYCSWELKDSTYVLVPLAIKAERLGADSTHKAVQVGRTKYVFFIVGLSDGPLFHEIWMHESQALLGVQPRRLP